jgi:predicted AAA+ superfamily ATPase
MRAHSSCRFAPLGWPRVGVPGRVSWCRDLLPPKKPSLLDSALQKTRLFWSRTSKNQGSQPKGPIQYPHEGRGWSSIVKDLRDDTPLRRDCVVLTGSNSRELREATKNFAGRRGAAAVRSDRLLMPIGFRDFCGLVGGVGFQVWKCHQMGAEGRPATNRRRKVYFTDPLIARMPSERGSTQRPPDISKLSEQHLGLALLRSVTAGRADAFAATEEVMYERTASAEIDFVGAALEVPFESKYVERKWRSESRGLAARYGRGDHRHPQRPRYGRPDMGSAHEHHRLAAGYLRP